MLPVLWSVSGSVGLCCLSWSVCLDLLACVVCHDSVCLDLLACVACHGSVSGSVGLCFLSWFCVWICWVGLSVMVLCLDLLACVVCHGSVSGSVGLCCLSLRLFGVIVC